MAQFAPEPTYEAQAYSYAEARALARELGLSGPVAITLVRRGYRTPEAARAFLEAAESHDPFAFSSMEEVCDRLLAAVRDGRRITVHGDYDADGVCSTAILVRALGDLGAECDWFLPDRADGYGLSVATIERLATAGTGLLLTADCGVGSVTEVARARELGLPVIVTDHHTPPAQLPDCPILHPVLSGYPCEELCATGVAYKLSAAVRAAAGRAAEEADADLDIVALATVADMVPLRGENRTLVRRGLAEARRAGRAGMRALMGAAGVESTQIDEGDMAFRLAPRINAAGRLYRADAGVELMLTDDDSRAAQIAEELNRANQERRFAERELEGAAEAARRKLSPEQLDAPALVLAGEGWQGGVVGIVASRMVERHGVPTVLIALDGDRGRGSGRSIPAFDLLGGLEACSEHLASFGGHRAAAGLEIEAANVDGFREAFLAHATAKLGEADLTRTETVDAVVSGGQLGLPLAEEIERLAPFGSGNPNVRLLVPSARIADVRPMGEDGNHARFSLRSGSGSALGVSFGNGAPKVGEDEAADAAVRLEVNHWNGAVEPRVVLRELFPLGAPEDGEGCSCRQHAGSAEWWERVEAAAHASQAGPGDPVTSSEKREVVEHPPGSAIAVIGELVSARGSVLALCADASRRRGLARHAASPARFGAGEPVILCGRCPDSGLAAADAVASAGGLVLSDYAALERHPELADGFEHVVLVDPPPSEGLDRGSGFLHVAWGEAERELALQVHEHEWGMRQALAEVYAAAREEQALAGEGRHPLSAELVGRCLRVLEELSLVQLTHDEHEWRVGVVSSEETDLERSPAFGAYRARYEDGKRFLSRPRKPK